MISFSGGSEEPVLEVGSHNQRFIHQVFVFFWVIFLYVKQKEYLTADLHPSTSQQLKDQRSSERLKQVEWCSLTTDRTL